VLPIEWLRSEREEFVINSRATSTIYPLLPYVILGAVDPAGNAWATKRPRGRPGFIRPGRHRLSIRVPRILATRPRPGMEDAWPGLLGIDLSPAARNRLNGLSAQ